MKGRSKPKVDPESRVQIATHGGCNFCIFENSCPRGQPTEHELIKIQTRRRKNRDHGQSARSDTANCTVRQIARIFFSICKASDK